MSYTKRDSGFGESLSLGGFNVYLGLSNEKKIKGCQVFIENFTDKKLEEIFPKKNHEVRNFHDVRVPNIQHIPNIPNAPNIQHIPNIQYTQNIQHIPNIQHTQNIPNIPNIPNNRNVQNIPHVKNVENPREDIPYKPRDYTPFSSYLGLDCVNRANGVKIPKIPTIVKSDSTDLIDSTDSTDSTDYTNLPLPSATEISINRSLQLILKSQFLTPSVRTLHSSILVDKKLYIFGGFKDRLNDMIESTYNLNPNDRFFYLDVSKPFDTSTLPWTAIPANEKNLPLKFFSSVFSGGVAASYGGTNNDTIYFINNEFDKTLPPVLSFNTKDNSWNSYSQQIISGERPISKNQIRPITDYSGKIYLLAGLSFTTLQGVTRDEGGMFIFDTINSNCVLKDVIDGMSRVEYSATLLPNGTIVYMGGRDPRDSPGKSVADGFRVVHLYNTNDNTWKSQNTFGDSIPNGDNGISSVLGLDGFRIIVFGGDNTDNKMLYVLDTTTFNYDVLLLDIDIGNSSNYIWTNNFNPNAVIPSSNSTQSDDNTGIIVGVVFGVLGIIFITSLSIFFFIKRRKYLLHEKALPIVRDGENVMPIPSGLELSSGRNS
ncbi:hypothetical protein GLOIN_2v1718651 [Rhizophagus irregularis DAOM 181602=DAOM 197198]|nr:hypothetical protein GLOIN_2v1718651 [Rhizophagus irregularis DAOM 181602=DAOM 197198]